MGNNSRSGVLCKVCHKRFSYDQWQNNQICEVDNCNCPNVQKSMRLAQEVITKMKASNVIQINSFNVPNGESDLPRDADRYYYDCPPVMKIVVLPPGTRGVHLNKKQRGGR